MLFSVEISMKFCEHLLEIMSSNDRAIKLLRVHVRAFQVQSIFYFHSLLLRLQPIL